MHAAHPSNRRAEEARSTPKERLPADFGTDLAAWQQNILYLSIIDTLQKYACTYLNVQY